MHTAVSSGVCNTTYSFTIYKHARATRTTRDNDVSRSSVFFFFWVVVARGGDRKGRCRVSARDGQEAKKKLPLARARLAETLVPRTGARMTLCTRASAWIGRPPSRSHPLVRLSVLLARPKCIITRVRSFPHTLPPRRCIVCAFRACGPSVCSDVAAGRKFFRSALPVLVFFPRSRHRRRVCGSRETWAPGIRKTTKEPQETITTRRRHVRLPSSASRL